MIVSFVDRDQGQSSSSRKSNTEVESQDPTSWVKRMRKIQVMREWVIKNFDDAFVKQSKYYNLRRRQLHFSKGDLVLSRCRTPSSKIKNVAAKLCPKFLGPYRVSKVLSQNVYELSSLDPRYSKSWTYLKDYAKLISTLQGNYPGFLAALQEAHRVEKEAREVPSTVPAARPLVSHENIQTSPFDLLTSNSSGYPPLPSD